MSCFAFLLSQFEAGKEAIQKNMVLEVNTDERKFHITGLELTVERRLPIPKIISARLIANLNN